jgi:hypothetical protein
MYGGDNNEYKPGSVTPVDSDVTTGFGATEAGQCQVAFAQVVDGNWAFTATAMYSPATAATTLDDCLARCTDSSSISGRTGVTRPCQFVTFDYAAASDKCKLRVSDPTDNNSAAPTSG